MDFNTESEKPQFIYKRNPLIEHAFQIFMFKADKNDYEPVGEYTLLDMSEDLELTEKKVINLISILNGKQNLMDLGSLTNCKVFFNIIPKEDEDAPNKLIFRNKEETGTSTENAMLILEKGVLHESNIQSGSNG